jgi:metal-responsive CopG/Arc/MetJ family transcriptional regulator
MAESPIISVRIPQDDLAKLDDLALMFDQSRGEIIRTLIRTAYDSTQGNPQYRSIMETVRDLRVKLEALTGE